MKHMVNAKYTHTHTHTHCEQKFYWCSKIRNNYGAIKLSFLPILLLVQLSLLICISLFLYQFLTSFPFCCFYRYCSSNYSHSNISCRSFGILEVIAKSYMLLIAIVFKNEKEQQRQPLLVQ